jgi:WD40 repeat protein
VPPGGGASVHYTPCWRCIAGPGADRRARAQCSEMADERPVAAVAFSPDAAVLATAAWSGLLKLWAMPSCSKLLTIRAHTDRVTGALNHSRRRPHTLRLLVTGL